jgi:hypothetical protein
MQWQREEWKKDSGWIEEDGGLEAEGFSDIKKLIHNIHKRLYAYVTHTDRE